MNICGSLVAFDILLASNLVLERVSDVRKDLSDNMPGYDIYRKILAIKIVMYEDSIDNIS